MSNLHGKSAAPVGREMEDLQGNQQGVVKQATGDSHENIKTTPVKSEGTHAETSKRCLLVGCGIPTGEQKALQTTAVKSRQEKKEQHQDERQFKQFLAMTSLYDPMNGRRKKGRARNVNRRDVEELFKTSK